MVQSISVEANKPLHHRWMMLRLLHKLIRVLRSQYLAHVSPWTNLFFFKKDLISRLKEQQRASWMILTPGMNSNNFFLIWFHFEIFWTGSPILYCAFLPLGMVGLQSSKLIILLLPENSSSQHGTRKRGAPVGSVFLPPLPPFPLISSFFALPCETFNL